MRWADTLRRLADTSNFRHAAIVAWAILLIALAAMLLSSYLIDKLIREHVRDIVSMDLHNQSALLQQRSHLPLLSTLLANARHERDGIHSLLLAPDGTVLFGDAYLLQLQNCWQRCLPGEVDAPLSDSTGNLHHFQGMQLSLPDQAYYLVVYDILPMQKRVKVLPLIIGAGLFLLLISSLGLGLYASMLSMRRVDRIRQTLRGYIAGNRALRLPEAVHGDEFDLLAADINRMLDQLNHLMDELKDVSSHMAHELRTPLTRLHQQLETVAEHVRFGPGADAIHRALEEAERIQRMFKAILRIGEVESARCAHAFAWFAADRLLQELADYYQPLAECSQVTLDITVQPGQQLYGDQALLFQAMANLLENAFKYGKPAGHIRLFASIAQQGAQLGVADEGCGIPPHLRADATRRFRRLGSREAAPGHGLGLALVSAITRLHGGTLQLRDQTPCGLLACIVLPQPHLPGST
jgi:signal transduction histidine kinase